MKKTIAISTILIAMAVLVSCSNSPYSWDGNVLKDESSNTLLVITPSMSDGISSHIDLRKAGESTFKLVYHFKAVEDVADAFIKIDVAIPKKADWWMIPSVSYNGNRWGSGLEPKGASDGDDGWWTYSFRRSPIPGATYSESGGYAVATWSDVPQSESDNFSYCIMPEENSVTHRIVWPEEETPRTYCSRDVYADSWRRTASMKKGETRDFVQYIDVTTVTTGHRAISHFLKKAWDMAGKVKFSTPSEKEIWTNGIKFFKESLWDPSDECIGFRTGVTPDYGVFYGMPDYGDSFDLKPGDKDTWRKMQDYSCAWVGQNLSAACSLLADYLKTGDQSSEDMGIATLDWWVAQARPNGLFPSHSSFISYDACHMGTASQMLREAYYLAKECQIDRPEYLKVSLGICDLAIRSQREDGCYGRSWIDEGEGVCNSYKGFTACYLIPAMVDAYKETGNKAYLESARKAFDFYIKEFDEGGFTTAGALDTDCIDKESSLPFFIAAVHLYEVLQDKRYLDDAIALGYYISTWLWHYDGIYPKGDTFTEYGFHTFGGTAISTQHQALDTFGLLPVPEMIKLSEYTGDSQWKEKGEAMWNFCCQLISDGTLKINGRVRPAGGQSEAFFQAPWYLYNNNGRFDNWLVAWPNALRLEFIRKNKI